ncbi:MAG: cyclic nucleotide-binding domain-containing protein [Pseudomonadota bacterium]
MSGVRQIVPKARKVRDKADACYQELKWEKALELYLEADRIGPFDPRIGQRIADLHKRLGRIDDAIEFYKKVADSYSNERFWAKGIAISKMILELDPDDEAAKKKLSELCSARQKAPAAQAEARGARTISGVPPREPIELTTDLIEPSPVERGEPVTGSKKIPLFSDLQPDELSAVLERFAVRRVPPQAYVCEEGDAGDSMFLISEGTVEVSVRQPDGSPLVLARLSGGDFFGEYSLIMHTSRNASVRAVTELELLEISARDIFAIADRHPQIWTILDVYLRKRVMDTIFSRSTVFRVLSATEREKLSCLVTPRRVKTGETVMEEKTEGDKMFFIRSGKFVVTSQHGKSHVVIGELGPGDYFGEVAMLTGKPRTAKVSAVTDSELFCLKRKDAAAVLRNNRAVLEALRARMAERSAERGEVLESCREASASLDLV